MAEKRAIAGLLLEILIVAIIAALSFEVVVNGPRRRTLDGLRAPDGQLESAPLPPQHTPTSHQSQTRDDNTLASAADLRARLLRLIEECIESPFSGNCPNSTSMQGLTLPLERGAGGDVLLNVSTSRVAVAVLVRDVLHMVEEHNRATRQTSDDQPARFSVALPAHGYGNVLQQLFPALLYSMRTHRPLVMHERFWDTKNAFLVLHRALTASPLHRFRDTEVPRARAIFGEKNHEHSVRMVFSEPQYKCLPLNSHFRNDALVQVTPPAGFDSWTLALLNNPVETMRSRWPPTLHRVLFDTVLPLHPALELEVNRIVHEEFGAFTVAIQARRVMADGGIHPPIPLEVMLQAGMIAALERGYTSSEVRFFVASPDLKDIQRTQRLLGSVGKQIFYLNTTVDRISIAGRFAGYLNIAIMARCDDIVTSEHSSFGTNAAAIGGLRPMVCNHQFVCTRRIHALPCNYAKRSRPCNFNPTGNPRHNISNPDQNRFMRWDSVDSSCQWASERLNRCKTGPCPDYYDSWVFRPKFVGWPPPACKA